MPDTNARRPRWIARFLALLVVLSVMVPVLVAGPLANQASATTGQEAEFHSLLNGERAGAGLPGLANDPAAAQLARQWASTMAAQSRLRHNPELAEQVTASVTADWQRIGENVGVGYSVRSLHDAFMASAGHRANILGDFNRVGIGVVNEGSGRMWVTAVLIKGPAITSASLDAANANPEGSLDSTTTGLGTLRVAGWALDPNATGPIQVHVYVGNVGTALTAAAWRGDVGAAYPSHGSAHGFAATVKTPSTPGDYDVCAFAINVGPGSNELLGCRRVTIDRSPAGSLDGISMAPGSIRVAGWAVDPDRTGPIDVHVWVGGVGSVLRADRYRSDLASLLPGYGGGHGFAGSVRLPTAPGLYDLCAYGINQGAGSNRLLGCRTVKVERNPLGSVDLVARVAGGVRVSGWSLDPDTSEPIDVHVYVGSTGAGIEAARSRGDIAKAFPGFGDRHGFDLVVPTGSAKTTVCVYGINTSAGSNRLLGCRTV